MNESKTLKIVAAPWVSVSDKIRALDAAGYPRAEIARILGKRYQHVRNVLEGDKLRRSSSSVPAGLAEPARRFHVPPAGPEVEDRGGGVYRLVVREDGSVMLPAAARQAFGVAGGGVVMARLEADALTLVSGARAMRRVDEVMGPYRWKGGSLTSDDLIAERRAEQARDDRDD